MRIWTASKPRGSIDRKRVNINNMNPFAIVDPRELSRSPNADNLSGRGITINDLIIKKMNFRINLFGFFEIIGRYGSSNRANAKSSSH